LNVEIAVRVHPRASRQRLLWDGVTLEAWVTAPAVEGAANEALLRAVAAALGLRRSSVALVAGERGRLKRLRLQDLDPARLEALRPSA
jgi:uncharacterized protein